MNPLTRREAELLNMIADGKKDQAIAADMGITISTVKTHRKGLYLKLNAVSRAHAVTRAYQLGLIKIKRKA